MTFTVGGVDVTAVHVGATAADAVYLGDVKVWPTASVPLTFAYDGSNYKVQNHTGGKTATNFGGHFYFTNDNSNGDDIQGWTDSNPTHARPGVSLLHVGNTLTVTDPSGGVIHTGTVTEIIHGRIMTDPKPADGHLATIGQILTFTVS